MYYALSIRFVIYCVTFKQIKDDMNEIPKSNLKFFNHAELEETVSGRLRQRSTTENGNINVLGANLATSGCPSSPQSLGYTFIKFVMVENAGFAVGILTLSAEVPEI